MIEVDFDDLKKIELSEGGGGGGGGGQPLPPDLEIWKDDEDEDTDTETGDSGGGSSGGDNEGDEDETEGDDIEDGDNEGDDTDGGTSGGGDEGDEEGEGGDEGGEEGGKGGKEGGKGGKEGGDGGQEGGDGGEGGKSGKGGAGGEGELPKPPVNPGGGESPQRGGQQAGNHTPNTKGNKIIDILNKKQSELDQHIEDGFKPVAVKVPTNNDQFKPNTDEGKSQEEIESQQKERLRDSINNAKKELEDRGVSEEDLKLPDSFDKNLLVPSLNWRNLLRRFLTTSFSVRYDMTRPRKKALASGYWAAKRISEREQLDLVVAIDTSGSITDKMMNIFISEILGIVKAAKEVKVRILLWDTSVYEDVSFDTRKMNVEAIKERLLAARVRGGGTSVNSVKRHLISKGVRNISGFILFTDGYFYGDEQDNISLPDAKHKLFLLTPDSTPYPLNKYSTNIYKIDVLAK